VFDLNGRQYINIRGLKLFSGAIDMDDSSGNNLIDGITARYVSHFATHGAYRCNCRGDWGIILAGTNKAIINGDIGWSAGSLVTLSGGSQVVENNYLHDADYTGIYDSPVQFTRGATGKILRNTIRRTGRDSIQFDSISTYSNSEIAYNDISYWDMLVYDGGAFYTFKNNTPNLRIHHNLIHDGQLVRPTPPSGGWPITFGIYFDNSSAGSPTVDHNILWNIPSIAIISKDNAIKAYNNTIAGEGYGK
jgi:hypothetical protein